jgi:hypothetical protein
MTMYAKAITAFLTGVVGVVAMFVPGVEAFATPEMIAAVTAIVSTILVYAIPNKT